MTTMLNSLNDWLVYIVAIKDSLTSIHTDWIAGQNIRMTTTEKGR
jgi:hypothetical protein